MKSNVKLLRSPKIAPVEYEVPYRFTDEELQLLVQRVNETIMKDFMERHGAAIVAQVSEKVMQDFYISVGKGVVKRVLWAVGVAATVLLMFMVGTGKIKLIQ